jgi:DNA recombination protein RmuC
MDTDPGLMDFALKGRVIIATPTTLIALLMTVSAGWQERTTADNAVELKKQCGELYKRVCKFVELYSDVGKGLSRAIKSYNDSVGSMQSGLLVQTRRVNELGGFDSESKRLNEAEPSIVEEAEVRQLSAPEAAQQSLPDVQDRA